MTRGLAPDVGVGESIWVAGPSRRTATSRRRSQATASLATTASTQNATPRSHPQATPRSSIALALALTITALATARAHAQQVEILPPPARPEQPHPLSETLALGAAGALTAFLSHEAGHVAANLMLGNVPHLKSTMTLGFIPFFVINPGIRCKGDRCIKRNGDHLPLDRNGSFLIDTAGFEVQHIVDEIVLSLNPRLKDEYAPYLQGLLGFNIFLSAMYATAGLTGLEDQHGDLRTASNRIGVNERINAVFLLIPAALDVYRFFQPSATWAVWASRGTKASMLGVTFLF